MASDHRMRLTLRRNRSGGSESTRHRRRQHSVWEWNLESPLSPIPALPSLSPVADREDAQPFDLSERGVIFEGLTGLGGLGSVDPAAANDRATRRLMTRLASRQRLQREGGTVRRLRERETVAFRRGLYRTGIRVGGVIGGNQDLPQREISAESFCRNPSNLNRLRPWLQRELTVLYGAHDSLITIVQRIIMARIARHGLENTPIIEEELRPFLLARTDHFLHELVRFALSPLSLESYDLQAVYEPPDTAVVVDGLDAASDSSSVIAISEEEDEPRESLSDGVEPMQENQAESCLSLSGWDDETPGPSYSSADNSCFLSSFSPAPQETSSEDRGERQQRSPLQQEEEECLIVGYKKPIAERTPELVQLSSDSDEDEKREESKKNEVEKEWNEKAVATNLLPTNSPSKSSREESLEEAQASQSQSYSASPGRSQTGSQRHLDKDRNESGRKKREKRRNKRRRKSSGTFGNPNRSIFPSFTQHLSRSPSLDSSLKSSFSDSDWGGYCYSVVSPLTSSCPSTPLSSSSASFGSSPSPRASALTPPPKPTEQHNTAAEKPGGKRKYKSRHLDSDDRDPTWQPSSGRSKAREVEKMRKKEKEKRRKRRKRDRQRRESSSQRREDRSPSVEIVFEGRICSSQSPARKRRRKRHRKTLLGGSPMVITLDSESSRDVTNDRASSGCSSPFGSQQTVDFCQLSALPLVHSSGVGGALEGDIGELPVDILDRGSDGSGAELGQNKSKELISVDNSDESEAEIDVEGVETNKTFIFEANQDMKEPQEEEHDTSDNNTCSTDFKDNDHEELLHKTNSDATNSDTRLLASILSVLDEMSGPKSDLSLMSKPSVPHNDQLKNSSFVLSSDASHILTNKPPSHGVDGLRSPFYTTLLPPFQQLTENRQAPPLIKPSSPVHLNRNTHPPLKHKDSPSPNASCSVENSHMEAKLIRTDIANGIRTMHNLDTNQEVDSSLLACKPSLEPESNSFPSHSTPMPPFPDSVSLATRPNRMSSTTDDNPGFTSDCTSLHAQTINYSSNLEAHKSLRILALPEPKRGHLTSNHHNDSSSLLNSDFSAADGILNHSDFVRLKCCSDSETGLDIQNRNQTNTEDAV